MTDLAAIPDHLPENLSEPTTSAASGETGTFESPGGASPSKFKKILKIAGWTFLAIFFTLLFTLLKLPEDRLKNFIQGNIAAALSSQGIGFSAGSGHLSIFFGASYVMKDITLTPPPPSNPIQLAEISVSPSILPMLLGKMGGRIEIRQSAKEGTLDSTFSIKGGDIQLTYEANGIDVGKLGILPALANLRGSAILSGKGDLSGDLSNPSTLMGKLQLDLSKLIVEPQTVMGFSIPYIRVSEGKIDLEIDKSKAVIQTFKLGKSPSDDLRATITGNVTLAQQWPMSNLNLKAEFSLSQSILKSFVLLDALLGAGKQPDGSYAFALTGPLAAVNPVPIAAAGNR